MKHRKGSSDLLGRRRECEAIDRVIASLAGGQSRALVLRGESGTGKSALLEYAAEGATPYTVLQMTRAESEMELVYAGLHQLCSPLLEGLDALPDPQAAALAVAFGLRSGDAPDRFLVGLAVLGLLAEAASTRPLLCLIDDAQWLDSASAQILSFVARRLVAESVGMIFAIREPVAEIFAGIEDLAVDGLDNADSAALLESVITGPIDPEVRERLIGEARGNPLALIELSRGRNTMDIAGGFGMIAPNLTSRIEESFVSRIGALPPETRSALLVAAIEPVGDLELIRQATDVLGIAADALIPAEDDDLIHFDARVRFRHPLVRSAVVRANPIGARRAAHGALAAVTDPTSDPDRRAWHLAEAAIGLDEDVARNLEQSAHRAQARGGMAAGAAFYARSAELTPDPTMRSIRALVAAETAYRAGATADALRVLEIADPTLLDDHGRARVELVRAHVTSSTTRGRGAPARLLAAARLLERHDGEMALSTYAGALIAALSAGRLAETVGLPEVASAVLAADPAPPLSEPASAGAEALHGLATLITDGYAAAAPTLQASLKRFVMLATSEQTDGTEVGRDRFRGIGAEATAPGGMFQWLPTACMIARTLLDDDAYDLLSARAVQLGRREGAFARLPLAMAERTSVLLLSGLTAEAVSLSHEMEPIIEATETPTSMTRSGWIATFRGDGSRKDEVTERLRPQILERGEGQWFISVAWQDALLQNSLGHHAAALSAAESAAGHPFDIGFAGWMLPEHVEAAVRSGAPDAGTRPFARLKELAAACNTELAHGLVARTAALLADDEEAERYYVEAISLLGKTRIRTALARAHLVYGEWLRRTERRDESRIHLRHAYELFLEMDAAGFAERARRELSAAGEVVRAPDEGSISALTAHERQIALLAASGSSNPEIGAQLFISPRTVEWHLRKVFVKLGVTSRRELAGAMRTS